MTLCFAAIAVWALCSAGTTPLIDEPDTLELVESAPIETTLEHADIRNADVVWLELIRGAQHTLDFAEFYSHDQAPSPFTPVIEAVEAAADRGVHVRFVGEQKFVKTYPELLERFEKHKNFEVRRLDFGKLAGGGILHAKWFIVDGEQVYIGSQNFDWRSFEHIQELGVRVHSKVVAQAFAPVFELDWKAAGGERPVKAELPPDAGPAAFVNLRFAGEDERVLPLASPRELVTGGCVWELPQIVKLIDGAKTSVRVQLLTYKSSGGKEYFDELETPLRRAAARGAKVELLVADWGKRKGTIEGLQSLQCIPNITVKLVTIPAWAGGYVSFARVVHAKYCVVDGVKAWIGTSNWEKDYFYKSRNVGFLVEGKAFAERLDKFFADGWSSSYATVVDPSAKYEAPRTGD